MELFSIYGRIGLDNRQFVQGVNDAERQGQSLGTSFGRVAGGIVKTGAAIGVAVAGVGVAAMNVGGHWEAMGNSIQAQSGMSNEALQGMKMSFRDVALEGNFTADIILAATEKITTSTSTAEDKILKMDAAMNFAAANGFELGNSAYFLSNMLLKTGKDASYAERYTNLFTHGIMNTNIGLSSLQNYMFRMTPAFEQFGASGETNVAILTRMYQAGIRGANLYSGMGTLMMDFATSNDISTAAIGRFNIATIDQYGNARDNKEMMFDLADAMAGYADQIEVARFITDNMNQTQQAAWFEFMNLSQEIRHEVIPSFYRATLAYGDYGVAARAAAENNQGFAGSLAQIRAAGNDALLTIFEVINAPVSDALATAAGKATDFAMSLREGGDLHPLVVDLGGSIANLAETAMDFATTITPLALRLLPMAATALTTVLDVAGPLAPVIVSGAAAFALYKKAMPASDVVRSVVDGIKGMTAATKAQKAMSANAMTAEQARTAATLAAGKADTARTAATKAQTAADALAEKAKNAKTNAIKWQTQATNAQKRATGLARAATIAETTATTAQTTATTLGTAAKGKATVAMRGLNAAMKANPVGLVLAGVTALISAVSFFSNRTNEAREAQREWREENQRVIESARDLRTALTESAEAHGTRMQAASDDARIAGNLFNQIMELNQAEELTAAQRARMAGLVATLHDTMDGLTLSFDQETGVLAGNLEMIEAQISARQEQARAAALQERAIELSREQILVEEEKYALQQRINEVSARAVAERERLTAAGVAATNSDNYFRMQLAELGEEMSGLRQQYADTADAINRNANTMAVAHYQMATGATAAADSMIYDAERTERVIQANKDAQMAALDALGGAYETIASRATDAFNRMNSETSQTLRESQQTLLHNAEMTRNWGDNIAAIIAEASARGMEDYLDHILEMANRGAGYAAMMVDDMDFVFGDLATAFGEAGEASIDKLVAVYGVTDEVARAAAGLAGAVDDSITQRLYEAGFFAMGSKVSDDLAAGITASLAAGRNAGVALAAAVHRGFEDGANAVNPYMLFYDAGEYSVQSAVKGIYDNADTATKAGDFLASSMGSFAREMGLAIPKDISDGMADGLPFVLDEASTLSNGIFSKASEWITEYRRHSQHTLEGELAKWQMLTKEYTEHSATRLYIMGNIARIENQLNTEYVAGRERAMRESYEHSRNWLSREAHFGRLTTEEHVAGLERMLAREYMGTAEVERLERDLHTQRMRLNDERRGAAEEHARKVLGLNEQIMAAEMRYQQAVNQRAGNIASPLRLFDGFERRVDTSREDAAQSARENVVNIEEQIRRLRADHQNQLANLHAQEEAINNDWEMAWDVRERRINDLHAQEMQMRAELRQAERELREEREAAIEARAKAEEEAAKTEGQILKRGLQQQYDEMRSYMENMTALRERGLYDGFVAAVAGAGLAANADIEALLEKSQYELEAYVQLWQDKHELARQLAIAELEPLREETEQEIRGLAEQLEYLGETVFVDAGVSAMEGYAKGMIKGMGDVREVVGNTNFGLFFGGAGAGLGAGDNYDISDTVDILSEKVQVFNERYAEMKDIVARAFTDMGRKSSDILRQLTTRNDNFLRTEGRSTGRNFFNSLGQGLIDVEASLLAQAMHTRNQIIAMFSQNSSGFGGFNSFGGSVASFSAPVSFAGAVSPVGFDGGGSIIIQQENTFNGVEKDQMPYRVAKTTKQVLEIGGF